MVHSDSASQMKTTPSVSPHLTVSTTAPPQQAAPPLVPPSTDTTGQELSKIPAQVCSPDLTSISDFPPPSAQTLVDAEPPVLTPVKTLLSNSSPASGWSSTQTTTHSHVTVNGRTSGRKRISKACDCCGPNSPGHNVRTPGRGRGRSRGKGRGAGRDLQDTPTRKVEGKLMHIKSFDLNKEKLGGAEDGNDRHEKGHMSVVMTENPSHPPVALPVNVSVVEGPMRCVPSEKDDPKKEDMLIEVLRVADTESKRVGDILDVTRRLSGMTHSKGSVARGRGTRGRWMIGSTFAPKMEDFGLRKELGDVVVFNSKADALAAGENNEAEMLHEEQVASTADKSPIENGDTINLSETEAEGEAKDDTVNVTDSGRGSLSISGQSGSSQDLNSEMHVDQAPVSIDSVSATLSNGNATSPTDQNHRSTPMDTESSHPATPASLNLGPIAVCSAQHGSALKDHRLYCWPGTWEKEEAEVLRKEQSEEMDVQDIDGNTQNNESLEQLIDIIHDFLESFYIKYGSFIPLSETDVLEHLKKNGNCDDLSNKGLNVRGEMTRYKAGLASAPFAGFMVMYNKHTLSLEDLGTLEEQNWLNDQIINTYGELIMETTQHKVHFFNSFFHKQLVAKGYDGVKRWTKKVDLFSKWLLLIPIHLEIHWSLVTVAMATKTISYYDSQGIVFRHTTDNIMKYLQSEAREKKLTAFQKGWKITIIKGIPQQKNDSDCGVFVLEYCRCLSVKQPLLFSQEDMPRIRKRIYKELCDRRLND